jgi:predicted nucleic acid-binding protein
LAEVRVLNVLIDINVVLDVLLAREPWVAAAREVWAAQNRREIVGHIAAHGITNINYVARRIIGAQKARDAMRLCMRTFEILPVGRLELELADTLEGVDIEDNLVLVCAILAGLDAIVTRDSRGFSGSPIRVVSPAELFDSLSKINLS